jgi:phage tail-like protein
VADHALLGVLPEVFRDAADQSLPLVALAAVATDLHAPVLQILDGLDEVPDPFRTPERMVGYLASWVDLDWLTLPGPDGVSSPALPRGSAPLRDLITASADLSARRGTAGALTDFLRIAMGVSGFVVTEVPGAFHVRVQAPHDVEEYLDVVRRIVATIKPAHVTAEVVLAATRREEDA